MTIAYNSAYIQTETLNFTFAQQAAIMYFAADTSALIDGIHQCIGPYGNIVNFSRTSRIHFYAKNTSFCPFKLSGQLNAVKSPNSLFLLGHVDPHLIHKCLR